MKAYQLKGHMDEDLRQHLIEGTVPTGKLLEVAHGYQVTVGVLIVSLYVEAMLTQITAHERRRPIVVSVPVNLRQYFPSATTRNFYGAIQIRFDPAAYQGTLESILTEIQKGFMENLTEENMFNTMNGYAALEHNYAIKMTPLVLKYWGIRGYNNLVKQGVTTSVSNIGKVDLPEAMRQYVSKFAAFMASRTAFLCLTSFGDQTVFVITSCFPEHTVFMHFFRRLTRLGIQVELTTNDYDREGV